MKAVLATLVFFGGVARLGAQSVEVPVVRDTDLEIILYASDPRIATPIGVEVDSENRVYVIESHTHMPPKGYSGPKFDRVKRFVDTDGDDRADRVTVFAEGFDDAMNLALTPGGELVVAERQGLVLLHDRDGDGVSEARTRLLELKTGQSYSHSTLLGVAVSGDGWVYASRGNTGGHPYTFTGLDGSTVEGYEDGGNIVRLRLDGRGLELFATGFWNPFDMDFDGAGRLLCVDNDPDSRGPNRIVHVVEEGDYGFRSIYGASGLHPFVAWNGELPGTLPFLAGTGEAPSAVLDCERGRLPPRYRHGILVTVWAEHSLELFHPAARGISLGGRREVVLEGGSEFRPVGLAAGPDGSIYVTDWVRRVYPNHGKGRIWKLSVRRGVTALKGRAPFGRTRPDPYVDLSEVLRVAPEADVIRHLASDDPYVVHAAVGRLAETSDANALLTLADSRNPAWRLGALLALRRQGRSPPPSLLERRLADADLRVRRYVLSWIGDGRFDEMRPKLSRCLEGENVTVDIVRAYIACLELLSDQEAAQRSARKPGFEIRRGQDDSALWAIAESKTFSAPLRTLALTMLPPPTDARGVARWAALLDTSLARPAVRGLAASRRPAAYEILRNLAASAGEEQLRADAVLGLVNPPPGRRAEMSRESWIALLNDPQAAVRVEALRAFRSATVDREVREAASARWRSLSVARKRSREGEDLRFALGASSGDSVSGKSVSGARPRTDAEWRAALAEGGDVEAGRRVFFQRGVRCSNCHRVRGRGGYLGPDLSHVASSLGRGGIVDSILNPSSTVSPEFQGYTVVLRDGRVLTGLQFHYRGTDQFSIMLPDGREVRHALASLLEHRASEASLMPDGLESAISVSAFQDLVAFLASLR